MFDLLHRAFEKKETDLYQLQQQEGFSRYILIRSLDDDHLKELIEKHTGEKNSKGSIGELYLKLYSSKATEDEIIEYIKAKYPEIREHRKEQEKFLPEIIKEFTDVKCGIRNDDLSETARQLVRDKSIKSKAELEKRVDEVIGSTIRGYILWQYYNQATNDVIEHVFNDHKNVIPTLRKITYVDFLIKRGSLIIPFDLKITHISDDYFDLHKKGLIPADKGHDSFTIGGNKSEMEIIKDDYKSVKSELSLPNYGSLGKNEILAIFDAKDRLKPFADKARASRKTMTDEVARNLKAVEWWNYKFQGERLFKNNNRFFIFLAYQNSFEDARPLKGKIEDIRAKVNEKLDSIIDAPLNHIKYYYEKDKNRQGPYEVNSTSVLLLDPA